MPATPSAVRRSWLLSLLISLPWRGGLLGATRARGNLVFGETVSAGVQQGDPIGSLLWQQHAAAIQPLAVELRGALSTSLNSTRMTGSSLVMPEL